MASFESGHADAVHDCQLDYYGTKLATCSSDRLIKVFSVDKSGEVKAHLADLPGHEGPVWQVGWAHPKFGTLLASCGYDGKVVVWKDQDGAWSAAYTSPPTLHSSSVNSVAWAPHECGLALACAASDGGVSVISRGASGEFEAATVPGAHTVGALAVSWAPAASPGALVGVAASSEPVKRLASAGCDGTVKIWAQRPGGGEWAAEATLEGHTDWVRDVAWAPNIGMPKNTIASAGQDGTVRIWTQTEPQGPWSSLVLHSFGCPVWRVSWSVTGNILAVSDANQAVTLWKEAIDGEWAQVQSVA